MVKFQRAEDAFEFYFKCIMMQGEERSGTKVLFNQLIRLQFPDQNQITTPWRRWKEDYAAKEYEWYKTGVRTTDMVAEAAIWERMKDKDGLVYSNYGYFWNMNGQLQKMITLLKTDPLTRRAIISHYDINEIDRYVMDTPCNVILNFYIHNSQLHLTVFARSIDLVYGFCNDQYCFSRLQSDIADELKIPVGFMNYMITNLHIYEKHYYLNERK